MLVGAIVSVCAAPSALAQGFGASVAVSGREVLAGDPGSPTAPGGVVIYRRGANGRWTQAARVTAAAAVAGDRFGVSMAVNGDVAVVAAPGADSGKGTVSVLQRDRRGTWTVAGQLANTAAADADFGAALAVGDGWIAVAAPAADSARGAVYLYRRDGASWTVAGRLAAAEPVANERFGAALAIHGDRLLVGAPGRDHGAGNAYLFRRAASGAWGQEARLTVTDLAANARLGSAVALHDSIALVSAPFLDQLAGGVYVFRADTGGAWTATVTLLPFNRTRGMRFGQTLAFSGSDVLVGAPWADRRSGALYRVRRDASGAFSGVELLRSSANERGDQFASTLAAESGLVVAGLGGDDYGAGTAAILTRDARGVWRDAAKVWTEPPGFAAVTGHAVRCDGHASIFGCSNVDLESFLPISAIGGSRGVEINDIWGWTDPQTGREYALVGRSNGTSFVDVTDASNPVYLGDLPLTEGANPAIWRDIKTYHNYAFVVADGAGQHGMQVFDLTRLRGVSGRTPAHFTENAHYAHFGSAHNIVINEASGYAYAVGANSGGETCGGGLHMIDIHDPLHPVFVGCFQDTSTGRQGTGYSHDAQCVMYHGPDTRYQGHEICLGSNETALSIADVTDKAHPRAVSSASYPNVGYTHQGWLTDDQHYFYMDDELDEMQGMVPGTRTLIWDLSDLEDPVLAGQYVSTNHAIDHNLYVKGNYLFESNYLSGLRVLDITNRTAPHEVGFLDTAPNGEDTPNFDGSWSNYPYFPSGNIVVSSIGQGLFVVRPRIEAPVP